MCIRDRVCEVYNLHSAFCTQPAFYSQSAVCILHSICILPLVGSLQSAVCSLQSAVCSPQSAFYTDRLRNKTGKMSLIWDAFVNLLHDPFVVAEIRSCHLHIQHCAVRCIISLLKNFLEALQYCALRRRIPGKHLILLCI